MTAPNNRRNLSRKFLKPLLTANPAVSPQLAHMKTKFWSVGFGLICLLAGLRLAAVEVPAGRSATLLGSSVGSLGTNQTCQWAVSNVLTSGGLIRLPGATNLTLTVSLDPLTYNNPVLTNWPINVAANTCTNGPKPPCPYCPACSNKPPAQVQYYCAISTPGAATITNSINLLLNPLADASFLGTNGLKKQTFSLAAGAAVTRAALEIVGDGADYANVGGPAAVGLTSGAVDDDGTLVGNVAARYSGYFVPPTPGYYVFFLAAAGDTDLFLSPDAAVADKMLIAQETSWSYPLEWITSTGGSTNSQKRSDTWSPDGGATYPFVGGIWLTNGEAYYLEAVRRHVTGTPSHFGFTYKLAGDPDPTNGQPSLVLTNQLWYITPPATNLSVLTNPTNQTVYAGGGVLFNGLAQSDSEFTPVYQWLQNGTNLAGATGNSLTLSGVTSAMDGFQYQFMATIPGSSLSVTSAVATLNLAPAALVVGHLKREFWVGGHDAPRAAIEAGFAGLPDFTAGVPQFLVVNDHTPNFGQRISGYFIPPATDNYIFFLASAGDSDLFLSPDGLPANKVQIAAETAASGPGQWQASNGGSVVSQKRSDQYLPAGVTNAPFATGFALTAGVAYYLEAVHHQTNADGFLSVTYATVGENQALGLPLAGDATRLTGGVIGFLAPPVSAVVVTAQPAGATSNVGSVLTLTVAGFAPGAILAQTGFDPNPETTPPTNSLTYQWFLNGAAIAGATRSGYTTPVLLPANNGDQYVCQLGALGYAGFSNSLPAVVGVNPDLTAPVLLSAVAPTNQSGTYELDVTFGKLVDDSALNPANYSLNNGATVLGIHRLAGNAVELVLSQPAVGAVLSAYNILDLAGNSLAGNPALAVTAYPRLLSLDLDPALGNPAVPGDFAVVGTNQFVISGGGGGVGNGTNDGFRFTCLATNGNFDLGVQVLGQSEIDPGSFVGIMVREDLTSQSRHWVLGATPGGGDGVLAVDGAGWGLNQLLTAHRATAGGSAVAGWGNWLVPDTAANFIPNYPNQWLRLARVGQRFFGYQSHDGVNWNLVCADSPTNSGAATPFPANVYVGLVVTAGTNSLDPAFLNTATFANFANTAVSVAPPSPATLQAVVAGGNLRVSWTPAGGRLETTTELRGAGAVWSVVGTNNPSLIPLKGPARYFRVINP